MPAFLSVDAGRSELPEDSAGERWCLGKSF